MIVTIVSQSGVETPINVSTEVSVGRDKKKCKICLPPTAEGVSRLHATFSLSSEGVLTLSDVSSFGTLVNGQKVNQAKIVLSNGDEIIIGGSSYVIQMKKNPTSPGLLVKPVNFSQSTKKTPTVKSRKGVFANESQRKMSDFFRSSQSVKSTCVLAPETPYSQLCNVSPSLSKSFVPETVVVSDSIPQIVIDDDDDDFCFKPSVTKPKAKSLLFQKNVSSQKSNSSLFPRKTTHDVSSLKFESTQILAQDTLDFKQSFPNKKTSSFLNGADIVDDSQGLLSSKEVTLAPDTICLENQADSMIFETSQNDSLSIAPRASKGKKRSILNQIRNDTTNFIPPMDPSFSFEPLSKRRPLSNLSASIMEESIMEETKLLSDSITPIFSMKDDKALSQKPKRGRKPIVQPKEEDDYKDSSFASIAPNRELLEVVYSGKKYDEEDLEDDDGKFRPNMKPPNIDNVVKKLDKLILFMDLTRSEDSMYNSKISSAANSFIPTTYSSKTDQTNFKRFRKANQGRFNNSKSTISTLGGSTDLVDFRKLRS